MLYIHLIIAVLLFNLVFLLGIVLGFVISQKFSCSSYDSVSTTFSKKQNNSKLNKTQIDETKFVTRIDTDNLEKKYTNLGETKESSEQISESVNKLKNLKG